MVWASETCEEREENGLGLHGLGIRNMRGERRKRVRTPWSDLGIRNMRGERRKRVRTPWSMYQKHARREKKTG